MRKVTREEILDYATWTEQRDAKLGHILQVKNERRIHVGEHLTFLFENTTTIRYQIQEMVRVEHIVRERNIQHEIDTYNELLGRAGELGFVLLIEIDDPVLRTQLLRQWLELPDHVYARLEDGTRIPATFDTRQIGEDRLSSVQYLKFDTAGHVPVAIGTDLPALSIETVLNADQRSALGADLSQPEECRAQ